MRRQRAGRVLAALLAWPAGGCGGAGTTPPADAPFPDRVGAFERVEPPVHGRASITAGYQFAAAAGSVMATVQRRPAEGGTSLFPALDIGRNEAETIAEAALVRSIAQIRRFYPEATTGPVRPVLLVRGGVLRTGRGITVDYREIVEDGPRTMQMEVSVLCCTSRREVVEYRFRHLAGLGLDREVSDFLRGFPWAAEEPGP
jgi:hypothetical protein